MRRGWPLLMAAFVSLFIAEGQRAFLSTFPDLFRDAVTPAVRVDATLWAVAPLLALLAPLLPLARWFDRQAALAIAALGVAVVRLPMTHHALETRVIGGVAVLAFGAMFLKWAVGYLDRRALAAGVVLGLVADHLLRLAGAGVDPSLGSGWLPVQAFLSLCLIATVVLWARDPGREGGHNGLERRAGGMRLRAGIALGTLLFLDLHILGAPDVVSLWTGAPHAAVGAVGGVASAAALAAVLLSGRPTGGRGATLGLVAVVALSLLGGLVIDGLAAALGLLAGHAAALLLVTRALEPASGRRSGVTVVTGFALFILLATVYLLNVRPDLIAARADALAPWLFGATGLLLAACFILLPRPERLAAPVRRGPAIATVSVVVFLAIVMSLTRSPGPAEERRTAAMGPTLTAAGHYAPAPVEGIS